MTLSPIKAHRLIAAGLGLFLVTHFAVHLSAILGPDTHLKWLGFVQGAYQNRVIEPLLVIAILIQIGLGMKFVWLRWKQPQKGFWGWMQILSGLYLAFFFMIHTSAALYTRYGVGLDTNFYWAAGTLNVEPLQYFFTPYYFLGVTSVFAHLASAVFFGWPQKGRMASLFILGLGMGIAALIVSIFSGAFYEIDLPAEYIEYFESYTG